MHEVSALLRGHREDLFVSFLLKPQHLVSPSWLLSDAPPFRHTEPFSSGHRQMSL